MAAGRVEIHRASPTAAVAQRARTSCVGATVDAERQRRDVAVALLLHRAEGAVVEI